MIRPFFSGQTLPKRRFYFKDSMRRYLSILLIPLFIVNFVSILLLWQHWAQYKKILTSITTVNEFNQDFKENIDLKMYYYVIGSRYSEGLPLSEVQEATGLADRLAKATTDKQSLRAIRSVRSLCKNLESKMHLIEHTKGYDDRINQLETNIYILTSLIENYMYQYIYYEANSLSALHEQAILRTQVELALMVVTSILTAIATMYGTQHFSRQLTKPLQHLCRRFEEISAGDLTAREPIQAKEYEIQVLSENFEKMAGQLSQMMQDVETEQKRLRSAELALLQAQVNPHFLYNTLDTIIWLIEAGKTGQAVEIITNLSTFFRTGLSRGKNVITLAEEENNVRSYLEIQQRRYHDILEYEIDIPRALKDCCLPKLTVQPLVENALYHGIKLKRSLGHIRVSCRRENDEIVLQVRDDGAGMNAERLMQVRRSIEEGECVGFGLRTVHERIQMLFGAQYGLSISSREGTGTQVTLCFPIKIQP